MSEIETKEAETATETTTSAESPVESQEVPAETPKKKSNLVFYVGSFLIVVAVILVVLFQLEKEGRSSTNLFSGIIAEQEASEVVATVNGTEITNSELDTSIEQFAQMAMSQGVDINEESVQSEIRNQAIEVLVNTELLKQEAASRDIIISDEAVETRLETITTDLGGADVLDERMVSLGIDGEELEADIREELLIQQLLDQIFSESEIEVTDEEIAAVYDGAGADGTELPPLEEVSEQVAAQIRSSKEQETIDAFLLELREGADIVIVE